MAENELDGYGPVDYLVVEFPAGTSNFTGEIAEEIVRLVEAGTIRVIDMIVISKDADGSLDAVEITDADDLGSARCDRSGAGRTARRGRRRASSPPRWHREASRACSCTRTSGLRRSRPPLVAPEASLIADGRVNADDVVAAFAAAALIEAEAEIEFEEELEEALADKDD